ncbi:MAG TPA: restriction endonuclease subunit S [Deltaproteobacteria bacterium]|nr:restriction endonuclease subunit S [Deltaproteobacteria bacterium]
MSFPRYPKYKESGVEWLGEVPEHWTLRGFRYAATINNGSDFKRFEVQEGGFPVLGSGGEFARVSSFMYDKPSVLLGRKGTIDNPIFIEEPFWTVDTLFYTCISSDTFPKFLYYFCCSIPFNFFQYGSAVPSMTQKDIYAMTVPTPHLSEQTFIAAFLDRETAKIDALIAEQQRLIELLKEKRQAVISHAVTKGLNPQVPMKPSGIEWIGDVPEHWEVGPVKRFCTFYDGRRIPLSAEERCKRRGEIPYYGASGIIDWIDEFIFEEDLVLVSEDGANLINRATPIAFVATGKYWVNNHAHILKPLDNNLIFWAECIEVIDLSPIVTGSAQPKLTAEALSNLKIVVPPSEAERAAVQKHIIPLTEEMDELTKQAQHAIELLQERRTALISAAVTGKIDVRGLAQTEAA